MPELDNDIIEDEEHDDATGDEEKKEEATRKQSAATFPDGSRKPSVSGEHNPSGSLGKDLDAVSDTVGSAINVAIVVEDIFVKFNFAHLTESELDRLWDQREILQEICSQRHH